MAIRVGGGDSNGPGGGGSLGLLIGTVVALLLIGAVLYFRAGGMDQPIVQPTPTPTVCAMVKAQNGQFIPVCGPKAP